MYVSLVILSLGLTYSKRKIGYEIRKKYLVDMNPAITLSLFLNTLMTLRILHFFRVEYSILIEYYNFDSIKIKDVCAVSTINSLQRLWRCEN